MNSAERDYQQKLRQAKAQGDGNPFVAGVQEVFTEGAGEASKESRTQYGNVNLMPSGIEGTLLITSAQLDLLQMHRWITHLIKVDNGVYSWATLLPTKTQT